MESALRRMSGIWEKLYSGNSTDKLEQLIHYLHEKKPDTNQVSNEVFWYKRAVVYALYVDLFAGNFDNLSQQLYYFKQLGVNCLWLLPVLESPMKDQGFDISDYYSIRRGLSSGINSLDEFSDFIQNAHSYGIHIIFDIAINHTSDQHPWFLEAKTGEDSPMHEFYLWSKTGNEFSEAPVLFNHLCGSNWEKLENCSLERPYYFHRFFSHQPDLNYANPNVLTEMTRVLVFWASLGLDGFRADAVSFLWKQENTDCANLPSMHLVVAFLRAALDFAKPGTILLAEACQKPEEIVRYFGSDALPECQAAYHFPLIPALYQSLATGNPCHVQHVLSKGVTPVVRTDSQWFVFLRCHDELNFEMLTPKEYKHLHQLYCHDRRWNFRNGAGIAARLADLMDYNPHKIGLAHSVLLSLFGTPILFYGDEIAKTNDYEHYYQMCMKTRIPYARYWCRGYFDINSAYSR